MTSSYGGGGNDKMWGGDGNDALYGEAGNDAICDATGYDVCATDGVQIMDGGGNDDVLWYQESENPLVPCPGVLLNLSASTPGSGTDQCGDNSNFVEDEELPEACDTMITSVPTRCDGAN